MYTKRIYSAKAMARWTRYSTYQFIGIIIAWNALYFFLELTWLKIPWTPLALIGTAVAFVIGFQNNSAYGRIWEARKIWGGIVNTSRSFGMYVQDLVDNENASIPLSNEKLKNEMKVLTHRHIAWMTALRHAMRAPKPWEIALSERTNIEWDLLPPEQEADLEEDLRPYLQEEDLQYVMSKNNKQTAVLYCQSHHLRRLKDKGHIWEFSFLHLESVLQELFTLQGKSERIKNFPYPRHFATLNHFFMWVFVLLLPMALVPQFTEIAQPLKTSFPILRDETKISFPIYVSNLYNC